MFHNSDQNVIYRADLGSCPVPIGLRSVGQAEFPPRFLHKSRKTMFYQFVWTLDGEGAFNIRGHWQDIKSNFALLVSPDEHYQIANRSDRPWAHRWFTFDGPAAQVAVESFSFPYKSFFAGPCPHETFDALVSALGDSSVNGQRLAGAMVYKFLSKVAGIAAGQPIAPVEGSTIDCLEKLADETILHGNVEEMAQASGVSRFTIHRQFKQVKGMPPKAYSDLLRLKRAVSLLRNSEILIRQIAKLTGFSNANYFAKFFRKKTGLSPSEFRNEQSMP